MNAQGRIGFIAVASAALVVSSCKSEPKEQPKPATTAKASATPSTSAKPMTAESTGVTRLTAPAKKGEELGYALAASADRVVVTAWKRGGSEDAHPGSIFVYKRDGAKLTLDTELTAEKSNQMGNVVALSGDLLAAGAMYDDGTTKEAGAAYLFSHGDSGWSKAMKLSDRAGKADDSFGIGIAIADKSIVVGNTRENGGSLFVYEMGKAEPALKQTLPVHEPNGPAEAIAAAGDVIVVGAQGSGEDEAGVAHVYSRGAHGFAEDAKLSEAQPGKEQHFGGSVAVGAGTVAIASSKTISLFQKKDGKWQPAGTITPPITLALSDAGLAVGDKVIAIGLPRSDEGRVFVYREQAGGWKLDKTLSAPDGKKDDWFGYSLAIAPKLLVIGAPLKDDRTGAVYTLPL